MKVVALGVGGKTGWAAIDEFVLARAEDCQVLPKSAQPSTAEPTIGSTVPPDEDLGCTFQQDFCNFDVRGDEGFAFKRMNGSEVPSIGSDHNQKDSGVFLYASSNAIEDSLQVRRKCIFCWNLSFRPDLHRGQFSDCEWICGCTSMFPLLVLLGRLFGRRKEWVFSRSTGDNSRGMIDLSKKQVSESDQVADKVIWLQQSATTTWTEVILYM